MRRVVRRILTSDRLGRRPNWLNRFVTSLATAQRSLALRRFVRSDTTLPDAEKRASVIQGATIRGSSSRWRVPRWRNGDL
jgi:hypothetical protein